MISLPNWVHNSGKVKRGKGTCKGRLKARKQALKVIQNKFAKNNKVR